MRSRHLIVAFLAALGCHRETSKSKVDSVNARIDSIKSAEFGAGFKFPARDPSDPFYENIEAPDSSVQAWHFAFYDSATYAPNFFGGSYIRHPSGLFILWLDTASRATEETPSRRVHGDSVVVTGLKHGELIARYCRIGGSEADRVVGILPDTEPARPRVAWMLDPDKVRITAFATDSLICRTTPPVYDEVDEGGDD